ncbi:MAG TPA: alpha/beta fold hydrolase [Steroidobacteraceae bacterium]|jgi:pimeloyl-ACP methyl ester carboxylesterase
MSREAVVYVHGLWSSRVDSVLLRRRLEAALGCEVWMFSYPSISSSMSEVIGRLHRFVGEQCERPPQRLHFVGHSLGGLVIYRFLERHTDHPHGRIVFIGTPAVACRAAGGLAGLPLLGPFAGKCVREELLVERERRWSNPRELGIIAGTRRLGFGRLVARLEGDNDGTITVSETQLPGASDFITIPASHMGLLVSARTAQETAVFLRAGHFSLSPRLSVPPVSSARSS